MFPPNRQLKLFIATDHRRSSRCLRNVRLFQGQTGGGKKKRRGPILNGTQSIEHIASVVKAAAFTMRNHDLLTYHMYMYV